MKYDKITLHAGVVQRLVCGLAKAETAVRFRSLAPKAFFVEIDVKLIEISINFEIFLLFKKGS